MIEHALERDNLRVKVGKEINLMRLYYLSNQTISITTVRKYFLGNNRCINEW